MYCTISRLRGAVSLNQVPYPAGMVSASSFCRRPPPWSLLLLALAPGSSPTLPHSPGAPPLREGESASERQASGGKSSGWAPQTHNRAISVRATLSERTSVWLKSPDLGQTLPNYWSSRDFKISTPKHSCCVIDHPEKGQIPPRCAKHEPRLFSFYYLLITKFTHKLKCVCETVGYLLLVSSKTDPTKWDT